ncbi:MAG TPA: hemerythrin domain-containing protein [Acidimicrobiales bacterium]|jgi:iron-sulfur cluster repair protein YtfE (RIC family)|nr:hemerythrin domain-containing protein [Acidimicrobiales bacterium]
MPDFVTLLTEDHRRAEQLFKQYDDTGDPQVALELCLELSVHATVEEEMLYGLVSAKVDNYAAAEARAEHQEAKDLIMALESMDPSSDEFVTTMTKLKTSVLHHVDEEEHELFPKILEAIPDTAAILGDEMAARKVEVEAQLRADRSVGMAPSTTSQKPTASPEPGW